MKLCPVASGSSGNCTYVGSDCTHILIDAGISFKRIDTALTQMQVYSRNISAIFITHEHSDHISGAGLFSRKHNTPIYASPKTWRYFERHGTLGLIAPENKKILPSGEICEIGDMKIIPFDIPHDSSEPVGYGVFAGQHKFTVATDIGCVTDSVKMGIADSDALLIESNHDLEMLMNGRYPIYLKRRVMGDKGHLSNANAGLLIAEMYTDRLKHIFLGHLSEENNRPLVAIDTVKSILAANNINCGLSVADRNQTSEAFVL